MNPLSSNWQRLISLPKEVTKRKAKMNFLMSYFQNGSNKISISSSHFNKTKALLPLIMVLPKVFKFKRVLVLERAWSNSPLDSKVSFQADLISHSASKARLRVYLWVQAEGLLNLMVICQWIKVNSLEDNHLQSCQIMI